MTAARTATTVVLAAALLAAAAPAATAAHRPAHPGPDAVQRHLDTLVDEDGVPGALAHDGRTTYTAGTAQPGTGRPMPGPDGSVRLASTTKAFTAVAVMRLVADGQLRLDDRAGRFVPQLAHSPVTVRQLLKQTSGLPEYTDLVDWSRTYTPQEHLALALDRDADFPPGTGWGYSNTNYLVLGMIIDRVSGTDFRTYTERHILRPLRLTDTYWPAPGELALRGPHARNYGTGPDGTYGDLTELPGHAFGAAGGLVSTPRDLNAFWQGLFGGRLLPGWALRLMTHDTTPVGPDRGGYPAGSRYGYGLVAIPLSCGGVYWGHGGDLPGNSTAGGWTPAPRRTVTLYTTTWAGEGKPLHDLRRAADAALCR